ncbi:MAG: S8 family serine peptidase [Lysobacter sp.]
MVGNPDPAFGEHLRLTNSSSAHAAGFTGEGVRIGVIDSGVKRTHPALWPRVTSSFVYLDPATNNLDVDDVVGHGTAVSLVMAGVPFGEWPGGIAPGAEIVSARIISDEPPEDDGSGEGNEVEGTLGLGLERVHQDLIDSGARIMNNSWGGLYWTNPDATDAIAEEYRPFIFANDGLVVFATGNESSADPTDMAALPSQLGPNGTTPAADLEVGWLTVAALDTANPTQLAEYSNACGIAMNYCLVAPGDVVVTGTDDKSDAPTYWSWGGTSFAAPQVSGAAALVWEAFPYFNNDMVRQTLLGTATDLGDAGVDATFGHGLLNVGRAVNGPSRLDFGDFRVSFDDATSVWSNPLSGLGALVKEGSGTLVMTGPGRHAGGTQVLGGELHLGSAELGGVEMTAPILIGSGATLSGSALALGGITNDGTFRPEAAAFRMGDYTQSANATLALMVGSMIYVERVANLDGNLHVVGVLQDYVLSDREVFLSAGTINGTFDSLTSAPNVFLDATIGYDASSAWLDINRLDVTAAAQSMGLSSTATASAARVENAFRRIDDGAADFADPGSAGAFIDGAGAIQGTPTAAAAERSLASLSGEMHGADTAFAMMAIEGSRHALESRLDAVGHGVAAGAWANRLDGERSMWSHTRLDANGWMLGHDRYFGPNLMFGAAFGQTDGFASHALRGDRERNRQLEGQVYASWRDHVGNYLLGRVAFGHMDRWMQRDILLGSQRFGVDTQYDNRYTTVGVQAGHRFELVGATLTPYVGAQSLQLDRDGFSEHGAAGFGLSTHDSRLDATQALAGARLERQWSVGATTIGLQGRLEWQRTLSQSGDAIDARFTGIDAWSPITGAGLGEEAAVFGLGLHAWLPIGGRLGLDLDGRRENGRSYTGAFANWSVGF